MFSVYENLHSINILELVAEPGELFFMLLYVILSCVILDIVPYA